jgi:glycerol-3-phosphate O-acyltransferase
MAEFHHEALRIRELLKYEFFFQGSEDFIQTLEQEMSLRLPQWQSLISTGEIGAQEMIKQFEPLIGHGTLRPFIEAYLLIARTLRMEAAMRNSEPKALIERALTLGKQRVLQQRIHCEESVSSVYFENAIKIAESLNLLEASADVVERRQQWLNELRHLTANLRVLASVSDARRIAERARLEETLAYS